MHEVRFGSKTRSGGHLAARQLISQRQTSVGTVLRSEKARQQPTFLGTSSLGRIRQASIRSFFLTAHQALPNDREKMAMVSDTRGGKIC